MGANLRHLARILRRVVRQIGKRWISRFPFLNSSQTGFVAAGNAIVTAATAKDFNLTGLNGLTNYKVYLVVEDTSTNLSSVQSVPFTTIEAMAIDPAYAAQNLTLFPNPATSWVNVKISESSKYKLVNMLGETIQEGLLNSGNNKVQLTGIRKGTYFLQTVSVNNTTTNKLIIR